MYYDQPLVGEVDAELLEGVHLEALEAEDVQHLIQIVVLLLFSCEWFVVVSLFVCYLFVRFVVCV